jgi:6,7-dimethyl-8-ribityllumazine synthase
VNEANIVIKEVPGAFELPLASKVVAEANNVCCVISIGAIIKGDTPHFDFISHACLDGLQNIAIETGIPMICGVLTTNNIEQAKERSDSNRMNKGKEFALSAMNMVDALG